MQVYEFRIEHLFLDQTDLFANNGHSQHSDKDVRYSCHDVAAGINPVVGCCKTDSTPYGISGSAMNEERLEFILAYAICTDPVDINPQEYKESTNLLCKK